MHCYMYFFRYNERKWWWVSIITLFSQQNKIIECFCKTDGLNSCLRMSYCLWGMFDVLIVV